MAEPVPDPGAHVLPDAVRARVVALAAQTLASLAAEEVPRPLQPFRRFTDARRARLAATPLAAAVERDESFRRRVALQVREAVPDLAALLEAGGSPRVPPAADPLDVAAAAYLLRPTGWEEVLAAAVTAYDESRRVDASAAAAGSVARLEAQLAAVRTQARADRERWRAELAAAKAEVADLRHRLHDAREGRRAAEVARDAALEEVQRARGPGREQGSGTDGSPEVELRRARARVAELESALEAARRSNRAGRAHDDVRLRLLLDTIVDSASGLRRELALPPPEGPRPAEVVAATEAAPSPAAAPARPARALPPEDPTALDQLLALPQVHLVVDGYNVTKTGYPTLPLAVQRDRLGSGLAALAARTGAEVTCCFDGAAVDVPVALTQPRGVRVMFSRPGETADSLIRRLVRAEPQGRPVVVVSSDREVAEAVRRSGAHPVAAAALVRRLERS